jgi:hypothetical protein
MPSDTNKPVNGQNSAEVESEINRLLGLLSGKNVPVSKMTYSELTTNIMDPFLELAKKNHYASVWYNCVMTYGVLKSHKYGKEFFDYEKRHFNESYLEWVKGLSEIADNDKHEKCRALASFFCGEYYRIYRKYYSNVHENHLAYKYYDQAFKLNFSLKPGTEMHDFFDPDADIITADIQNDPRLDTIKKAIRTMGASPVGQAERLQSMPITRIVPRLTPSSKITPTAGNTTNAYINGRRRNNLASEKGNIIKRVWLTVKDITRENDREGIVDLYDEILHLPKNPKDLTNEQTKLFIPTLPNKRTLKNRINPFKTFHKFTKASNENITRKINVQNNKGYVSMPTHEYIRKTQTPEMIENYQIMAYNELIGLLLVLIEKANDKFLQENEAQRVLKKTGQKFTSFFKTDEAGIISLDTLSENYVQSIIGYNMEEQIRNTMAVLNNKYSGKQSGGNPAHASGYAAIGTIIVFIIILIWYGIMELDAFVKSGGFSPVEQIFITYLPNFFTSTGSALSSTFTTHVLPVLIAEIALFQATAGVFTVASLSYKVYKMYRGRKRAFLLKDIFKQIHMALFKNNNTQRFMDVKDKVYFFKSLSDKEKNLLLSMGPKIDMQTSDKELSEYLSKFLSARQARLESSVIKSLAKGNTDNEKILEKALQEGMKLKPGNSFTTTNPVHITKPNSGSRKRSVTNKSGKMLPVGVHRIEEGGKNWIEDKNGKKYKNLNDYMSRNKEFTYNESKSKVFDTYADGTALPKGWLREVQGDETWYQRPDGVTQWDPPPKGTSV